MNANGSGKIECDGNLDLTSGSMYKIDGEDLDKGDIGLGNVPNTDATNASNIGSGTLSADRIPTLDVSKINVDAEVRTVLSAGDLSDMKDAMDLQAFGHDSSDANEARIFGNNSYSSVRIESGSSPTTSGGTSTHMCLIQQTFNAPSVGSSNTTDEHAILKTRRAWASSGVADFKNVFLLHCEDETSSGTYTPRFTVNHLGEIKMPSIVTSTVDTDTAKILTIDTSHIVKKQTLKSIMNEAWTFTTGGYCRTSDTSYYMSSYKGDETWANVLSASVGGGYLYSDVPAVEWIAPADGKITNIRIVTRATAVSDAMKIVVFKGTLSDDQSSIALTEIGTATNAMGATNKYYYTTQDVSVSNTFSEGDGLFVGFAKTEDTGTSTYNFSVTVTGAWA